MVDSAPARRPSAARERIQATADRLFYREGIRAVGVERIVAEARVTRVTFYRHFPAKDDLIIAYLTERAGRERSALAAAHATAPDDPRAVLRAVIDGVVAETLVPGFRGCPFINAAAEFADPAHPVRQVVTRHRAWFHGELAALAGQAGAPDPDLVADQLVVLRDATMVGGYLGDPHRVAEAIVRAGSAVLSDPGGPA